MYRAFGSTNFNLQHKFRDSLRRNSTELSSCIYSNAMSGCPVVQRRMILLKDSNSRLKTGILGNTCWFGTDTFVQRGTYAPVLKLFLQRKYIRRTKILLYV